MSTAVRHSKHDIIVASQHTSRWWLVVHILIKWKADFWISLTPRLHLVEWPTYGVPQEYLCYDRQRPYENVSEV
jgi:hypothetical protein